jgi:putative hydrolase of the HAD superfamily
MNIDMIGFDADDTLWHTEIHYLEAQDEFKYILSPWGTIESITAVMDRMIIENLSWYGYGVKALILSFIEAAIQISQGEIRADQIDHILSIGKRMLAAEIALRPFVLETLQALAPNYPLMLITKGDLLDQTTKLRRAGIGNFFSIVEIVNEKSPETYARILEKHQLNPTALLDGRQHHPL